MFYSCTHSTTVLTAKEKNLVTQSEMKMEEDTSHQKAKELFYLYREIDTFHDLLNITNDRCGRWCTVEHFPLHMSTS